MVVYVDHLLTQVFVEKNFIVSHMLDVYMHPPVIPLLPCMNGLMMLVIVEKLYKGRNH